MNVKGIAKRMQLFSLFPGKQQPLLFRSFCNLVDDGILFLHANQINGFASIQVRCTNHCIALSSRVYELIGYSGLNACGRDAASRDPDFG